MAIYYYYNNNGKWLLIDKNNNFCLDNIFKVGSGYTELPNFGLSYLDFYNMKFLYNNVNCDIVRLNYELNLKYLNKR